jgi:hypothetical protein
MRIWYQTKGFIDINMLLIQIPTIEQLCSYHQEICMNLKDLFDGSGSLTQANRPFICGCRKNSVFSMTFYWSSASQEAKHCAAGSNTGFYAYRHAQISL